MPGLLNKTRRMSSETATCQHCLAQIMSALANKRRLGVVYRGRFAWAYSLAASSVPSEQPDSWLNKQKRSCAAWPKREGELFQLCRAAFRHLTQHRGAQKGFFFFQMSPQLQKKLRIKCEKVGKYQTGNKCMCSAGRKGRSVSETHQGRGAVYCTKTSLCF